MTKTLKARAEEMKRLAMELEQQGEATWEDYCGYKINEELHAFVNLTAEESYNI